MEPLISILTIQKDQLNIRTVRNASWALSNLCRGRNPPPDMAIVSRACYTPSSNTGPSVYIVDPVSYLSRLGHVYLL